MQKLMSFHYKKNLRLKATHYALGRNENKFQRFATFNSFVNKKLDRNKSDHAFLICEIIWFRKENECLWNEIKSQQTTRKMLNENSNKTNTNWKAIQKKKHIPGTNVVLLNNEKVTLKNRFDVLSAKSKE